MIAGTLELQMRMGIAELKTDVAAARREVAGMTQGMERAANAARSAFAALGITLGVGAFASMIKGSIDAADHLNDLSKSTALTVEQLAGLRIAAKQSGTDLDGVATSITRLAQNMGKNADQFKAAGITARDPLEAFKQLADLFVAIEDPQTRAALGAATLGKSWATAAPLLAEGGAAIGEMIDKGTRLSGVTAELAKQSDAFNDKLVLLTGTNSIMNSVTGQLLPLLNKLAGDMLEARERAEGLSGSFSPLLEAFKAVVVVGGNVSFVLAAIGKDLGATAAQLVAFASGNWGEILTIRAERLADAAKERSAFDAWERSIMAVGTAAQVAASKLDAMDAVSRRMDSEARARAREESEAAAKRVQALIGGTGSAGSAKKLIDEIAAHNKRMRDLDSKGWVAKIEADIREYEDGLAAMRKIDEDGNAARLKADAAFFAEKERLRKLDEAGWIAYIEATTSEYEAGLLAIHAATESNAESSDKAKKAMAEYLDPAKAKSFGDALSAAFGSAGSALGKLINSLEDYGQKMAEIEKMRAANAKINDPAIRAANEIKLAEQSANAQISAYGDMAAAAKGFFETGSTGYKALEAAEKVFRAFELASAIQTMLTKSGLLAGFTSLFVASKATETAATVASVAPDVAASMVKGEAAALAGVANQAQGDPYTAWARMAAMAAVMVGLGFAVSGSFGSGGGAGSGGTAAEMQRATGTGTVLGDAEAQSQSINNALRAIEQIDTLGLTYTQGMLSALKAIEANTSALAGTIYRAGLTNSPFVPSSPLGSNGGNFGGHAGSVSTPVTRWVEGSVTQTLIDSGIAMIGTLFQVMTTAIVDNQANFVQGLLRYGTVNVNERGPLGGLFGGNDDYNRVDYEKLPDAAMRSIRLTITSMLDAIEYAAKGLGFWTPQLREYLLSLPVDMKLSLDGLKGDELKDAVTAFFSGLADTLTMSAIPMNVGVNGPIGIDPTTFFDQFQRAGEGAFETLVRVATEFDVVSNTLAALGMPIGAVSMDTLAFTDSLVELMGGLDKFQDRMASYVSHYYTPIEQRTMTGNRLDTEFTNMGFVTPTTLAGFRSLVEGIDRTSEAGAALYARMMDLEGVFYDYTSEALKEHIDLQERYDQALFASSNGLQGRSEQHIQREHEMAAAIDETSRGLLRSIYLEEDRVAGLEKERAKLEARFDLEQELLDLTQTESEALERHRSLRMTELGLREIELGLAPGTLKAIQAEIDKQTDLNKIRDDGIAAMKTTSDLEGRLGVLRGDYTQRELDRAREWQAAASDTDRVLLSQIYAQEDLAEATRKTTEALDKAKSSQQSMWERFATDAQKTARATQVVNDGFAALGISVPQSGEAFANLVAGIDATTPAGQALLAALDLIAPSFSAITSAALTMIGTLYGATPAGTPPPGAVWVTLPDGTGYWMVPPGAGGTDTSNADSIARQRRQLEIELQRALGNDEIALMMERAGILADLDVSLHALQQEVWAALDAQKLREATEAWVGTLQDFLRGLTLDSTLSPLTARQRFSAAEAQYMQDYLLAGSGDAGARERYTAEAEAYLREALAMFGRASTDYQAIFRDVQMQTQGLIDQGLAPSAPVTVGDVNTTLITGQESAKAQTDELIASMQALASKVDTLTRRVEDSTTASTQAADMLVGAVENVGKDTATEIANRVPGGALS